MCISLIVAAVSFLSCEMDNEDAARCSTEQPPKQFNDLGRMFGTYLDVFIPKCVRLRRHAKVFVSTRLSFSVRMG